MKEQTEAMMVLAERIKSVEENNRLLEMRIVAAIQTIQKLRHDITIGRVERTKANGEKAEKIVAGILDESEIVVPPQLAILPSKIKPGGRKTGARNRKADIVSKRWGLWKIQYEAGYTTHQIARAWRCCRTSVEYAKKKNFVAGSEGR